MLAGVQPAFWLLLLATIVFAVATAWIVTRTLALAWPLMWRAGLAVALFVAVWIVIGLFVKLADSMAGVLWADAPYGLFTFVLLTLVLGGAGAWATGRAMARTWRPISMLALYMIFLTAAVRFLHYALYGEPLMSIGLFISAYVWTMAIGALGYRINRAAQMANQYSWAFERSGLNWRAKGDG